MPVLEVEVVEGSLLLGGAVLGGGGRVAAQLDLVHPGRQVDVVSVAQRAVHAAPTIHRSQSLWTMKVH